MIAWSAWRLGRLLDGRFPNNIEARKWLTLAAELGSKEAIQDLEA